MKRRIIFKILLGILALFAIVAGGITCSTYINRYSLLDYIKTFDKVQYSNQLKPYYDEELECYTFKTDEEFRVLQLTDLHVGGGKPTNAYDKKAINAVASMVSEEKPDLVIITGDLVYPSPEEALTFNNLHAHTIVSSLMDQLGVYYTVTFGNHDSEVFNFFNRRAVGNFYDNLKSEFLLFDNGLKDITGECNHYINIKNTQGLNTQTLYMIDSNAYYEYETGWDYDYVRQDQINWYEEKVKMMHNHNKVVSGNENTTMPKSLIFQHIPILEFKEAFDIAWDEETKTFKDNTEVTYNFGRVGEPSPYVYPPLDSLDYFDKIVELDSTKGMFFGHDHLNNFSLTYKGVTFTYGLSVDYLAYGADRGCTIITCKNDGSFSIKQESYYQDKYKVKEGIDKND